LFILTNLGEKGTRWEIGFLKCIKILKIYKETGAKGERGEGGRREGEEGGRREGREEVKFKN